MLEWLGPLLAALPLGAIVRGMRGAGGESPRTLRPGALLPPRDRLRGEASNPSAVAGRMIGALQPSVPVKASIIDQFAQPVVATDLAGRILWWNRRCEEVLPPPAANPAGRPVNVLGLPFPAVDEVFQLTRTAGRTWQQRASLRRRDGSMASLLVEVSATRGPAGDPNGLLLVATDVGALAGEHDRIVGELERANRIRSDFVATMSHELRTPLHVILGYADLLHGGEFGPLNEGQAETVERLLRRARELHELVANTLDVSRIDSGGADVHVSEIVLARLVEDAVGECQRRPGSDGPVLALEVADDLPRLLGDAAKIKVVLKNLVGNALKFTDRGSVTVRARAAAGGIEIAVADTGVGMDAEVLPQVFDAFR